MLLVALLVLAILTERGSIALTATVNEMANSQNHKAVTQAFMTAEAGIEEAKSRLMGSELGPYPNWIGDPNATPNPNWSAYVVTSSAWTTAQDPDFNSAQTNYFPTPGLNTNGTLVVNSLQAAIPYWTKIKHKTEYDAEQAGHKLGTIHYQDGDGNTAGNHTPANPGSVIYYGYPPGSTTLVQFTITGSTTGLQPVELVRAYARSGSSWKSVEIEVGRSAGPPVMAPVYVKGDLTFQNNTPPSGFVDGVDWCGGPVDKPPMYIKTGGAMIGNAAWVGGTQPSPQSGPLDIDLRAHINKMKGGAIVLSPDQNNPTGDINVSGVDYGSDSQHVTVYSNPQSPSSLRLENVNGYGLLLVDGNLILDDNLHWNGAVLVNGNLTFHTLPGGLRIRGTVAAGTATSDVTNAELAYDSCALAKALQQRPLQILRWKYRS